MDDKAKHPAEPKGLPACEHGNRPGAYSACHKCTERDKAIRAAVKCLVDEFWEHRGQRDLGHLMQRAYRQGREEFRAESVTLSERVATLEAALEWYANKSHYNEKTGMRGDELAGDVDKAPTQWDRGNRARQALKDK